MNLNFLKKLKFLGPALAFVPGVAPFAPLILAGIELAEASGKPGAEKKIIAREAVALGADTANAIKANSVDKDEALAAYDASVDAVVKVVKLSKDIPSKD